MLPKPRHNLGYSKEEILQICRERKIHHKRFWKAFGIGNTVAIAEDNQPRFYVCDVERALYKLNCQDGKFHVWD